MIETRGNLWDTPGYAVRVITTNGTVKRDGTCVMGRGCAKEARDKFPGVDARLGLLLTQHGNRCFRLGKYSFTHPEDRPEPFTLASMPVKHNWWEVADLKLIATSAWQLMDMADKFDWPNVLMPRPGCGNGQLDWEIVGKHLRNLLDDRFTVITF